MMIDEDIRMYLRLHPKWYLILSRYPQEFPTLLEEYRVENKLTMADRIEKIGTMLQMLEVLL
ncbi:MAG: hypothetical protein KHZ15_10680 [Coprobacillus cateniformis]|uniref:YlbE-like protein n=1 Tax=Longibaculum muris TaxID=1796628 RepID=A0A4R3Z3C6_9FIRM|nr:YlbE-like family protein [Longibaculum muris]KXU51538.1 hypothetical protein HMPREF3037_00969 [Candidatus Stoquefichus sp. KLE1796]MBS5113130.1 hypothetical protein [Coprobacillus cateniformis]MBS5368649.1 hypothetical protein [Coprobacillus cateniformis]MCR1888559.1 YlbE-like family protein [Longibaculum muris]MED9810686.1 YlbE-like family protein [Longibaculum muris]